MRFGWIKIATLLLLVSCSGDRIFDKQYYSKDLNIWEEYFSDVGLNDHNLKNQVLFVVNSTICSPCENELKFWDDMHPDLENSLNLIVVEKYPAVYKSFVSRLNLQIPAIQDSSALIFERDLIPVTPVKLYFNENSEIEMIYPVGTNGRLEHFLERIR
jgi:hypothetical protein